MRRPRHLSPEERELWDLVARQTTRRAASVVRADAAPNARVAPTIRVIADPVLLKAPAFSAFRLGEKADHRRSDNLLPGLAEDMGRPALRMDAKAHAKLTRGKLRPEGRIDLHGMILSQAHPALTGFILMSHAAGKRLVLVITGKGRPRDDDAPMPVGAGLLRRQVPMWLAAAPLGALVLQTAPAHISHGGGGALYVYLKRHRT